MFQCLKRLINDGQQERNYLVSIYEADLYFDIQKIRYLYVYTDIVKPSFVGNSYRQLLRVCEIPFVDQYSKQITISYNNPYYIPVSQNEFDLIEIDLKDDAGTNIAFQFGRVLVTLEYKKDD